MDVDVKKTLLDENLFPPLSRAGGNSPVPIFARENLCRELLEDLSPLLQEHYREIAQYQDIPLAPDLGKYNAVHQSGNLRIYTVRINGKLVGYGVFVTAQALHYSTSFQATQDVFFLTKQHRGNMMGAKLIAYCEEQLRREGVQVVAHHVKVAHPKLGQLLGLQGYEKVEEVWQKRLDLPSWPVPTHRSE